MLNLNVTEAEKGMIQMAIQIKAKNHWYLDQ